MEITENWGWNSTFFYLRWKPRICLITFAQTQLNTPKVVIYVETGICFTSHKSFAYLNCAFGKFFFPYSCAPLKLPLLFSRWIDFNSFWVSRNNVTHSHHLIIPMRLLRSHFPLPLTIVKCNWVSQFAIIMPPSNSKSK